MTGWSSESSLEHPLPAVSLRHTDPLTANSSLGGTYDLDEAASALEGVQTVWAPATGVRLVRFEINSAHTGVTNDYAGLSEVRFVPEPDFASSIWIPTAGLAGTIAARQRKSRA